MSTGQIRVKQREERAQSLHAAAFDPPPSMEISSQKEVGSWPQLAASPISLSCQTSVSTLRGPLEIKAIHSLSWTPSSLPTPTGY